MANPFASPPILGHVLLQLEKMLTCVRFENAPNQAAFLKFVTTRALLGKRSTEEQIGKALFPKYQREESGDVRQTARNLRKTIQLYYAEEGLCDLVIIKLAEPSKDKRLKMKAGEAYTPTFEYNPRNRAQKFFDLAASVINNAVNPEGDSFQYLTECLALVPDHVDALLLLAKGHFSHVGAEYSEVSETERKMKIADELCEIALGLAPNYWLSHLVKGTFIYKRNPAFARAEIELALKLNREATEASLEYVDFLLQERRDEDAYIVLASRLGIHPEEFRLYSVLGTVLELLNRDEEAEKIYQVGLMVRHGEIGCLMGLASLYKRQGRIAEATECLSKVRAIVDPKYYSSLVKISGL